MKFTLKYDSTLDDDELIVTHNTTDAIIDDLHDFLRNQRKNNAPLSLFAGDKQYFIPMNDILFFETEENVVYAHTEDHAYESTYRLYELEDILTTSFLRISKSTICNTEKIMSISRYLNSSGNVKFQHSAKEVFVSRKYFPILKQHLEKRSSRWEEETINQFYSD